MSVIQSKINKPFDDDLFQLFLDDVCDWGDEEYRFQAGELGMHAQSEVDFDAAVSNIELLVDKYRNDYDLFKILDLKIESGQFVFKDSIIDSVYPFEIMIKKAIVKRHFESLPNSEYLDSVSIDFTIEFSKEMFSYIDLNKNISNKEGYQQEIINGLSNYSVDSIKKLFNKDSLSKNHFYKHVKNLMTSDIQNKSANFLDSSKIAKKPNSFLEVTTNTINTYKKYINLMKTNHKLGSEDPLFFDLYNTKTIEELDDGMDEVIRESELKKYMKKFIGSHKHLVNEDTKKLFQEIKDRKFPDDKVKFALSKIVLFKDSQILNDELFTILNKMNVYSKESIEYKIISEDINATPIYFENNKLAVIVHDLYASSKLAPSVWCISKNQHYFDDYKGDGHNIIVYDFNVSQMHQNSKIGLSVSSQGTIKNAFDSKNSAILGIMPIKKDILSDIVQGMKDFDTNKDALFFLRKKKNSKKKETARNNRPRLN